MTNCKRIGFNVLGQFLNPVQRTAYLDYAARHQPRVLTVMDNVGLAYATREATQGQTLVVHRQWHPQDAYLWRTMAASDYCDQITDRGRISKDIWLYVLNEPDARGDDLPDLLRWIIEVGDRLEARGYHAVLGNIGPATIEPETIESGVFETYLRRLAEWSAADQHYGGWHEYTGMLLPFGVGYWPVEYLEQPSKVQPSNWSRLNPMAARILRSQALMKVQTPPQPSPMHQGGSEAQVESYPHYWHLLRSEWFNLWAEEQGIGRHKIVLTEFGWDRMPDLASQMPTNIYQRLEQEWGAVGHSEIRGPRTLENVWRWYFPNWSFDEAAFRQLEWADSIYPENYVGMCLFGWMFDGHIDGKEKNWERLGYNLGDLTDLQARLIKAGAEVPQPAPSPVPGPMPEPDAVGCWPVGWVREIITQLRTRRALSLQMSIKKESLVENAQKNVPVPEILKSKRFWSALLGLIFMVLVSVWPEMGQHAETLQNAALVFVSLLIGGYALEDYAQAKQPPPQA